MGQEGAVSGLSHTPAQQDQIFPGMARHKLVLEFEKSFLHLVWKVLTTDVSLSGWREVPGTLSVQGGYIDKVSLSPDIYSSNSGFGRTFCTSLDRHAHSRWRNLLCRSPQPSSSFRRMVPSLRGVSSFLTGGGCQTWASGLLVLRFKPEQI